VKEIKIKTVCTEDDLAVSLYVDGRLIVKHLESNTVRAIEKLLIAMGVDEESFVVVSE
jgi:hypothetical protein